MRAYNRGPGSVGKDRLPPLECYLSWVLQDGEECARRRAQGKGADMPRLEEQGPVWVPCEVPGPFNIHEEKRHLLQPTLPWPLVTANIVWAIECSKNHWVPGYQGSGRWMRIQAWKRPCPPGTWKEEGPWWKWYKAPWRTGKGIQTTSAGEERNNSLGGPGKWKERDFGKQF